MSLKRLVSDSVRLPEFGAFFDDLREAYTIRLRSRLLVLGKKYPELFPVSD